MTEYTRPDIPYAATVRQNSERFKISTEAGQPITAESLDGEFNYCVDSLNALDSAISGVSAGILTGSNDTENINKVPVTDGASNISWTAVTGALIYDDAVTTTKILDQNITTAKLANKAVTTVKINDLAVTTVKIEDGNVTTAKIADGAVTWSKLGNAQVTPDKMNMLEVMQQIYFVGIVIPIWNGVTPPYHGAGMTWEAIGEGYTVMTGNSSITISGANRLDTGLVDGHVLTEAEMPAHLHTSQRSLHLTTLPPQTGALDYVYKSGTANPGDTSIKGGNQAHSHSLNVLHVKLQFWKRIE